MDYRTVFENFKNSNNKDRVLLFKRAVNKPFEYFEDALKFNDNFEFVDRSDGHEKMIYILSGYKPYLWQCVFNRVDRFIEDDVDVCILSPGIDQEELRGIAEENGWSYLYTEEGRIGHAQNIAIKKHSSAKYIYKIDEDIFIGKNFQRNLFESLMEAKDSIYKPGFIAPILNINNFSYEYFLSFFDLKEEYENLFNSVTVSNDSLPINSSDKAAKFIWRNSLPFDEVEKEISENNSGLKPIPYQFSIGAILFERELWEDMGYFKPGRSDQLGFDERQLATFCCKEGYTPLLSLNSFAGHFSYGGQEQGMKEFWKENKEEFKLDDQDI